LHYLPWQATGISHNGFSWLKSQFTPTGELVLARHPLRDKAIAAIEIVKANLFIITHL
jgi:hypothetical protein